MSLKVTGTDSFTEKVTKLVEEAKLNTQWRKQFMEWEREMARKFREGKAEGIIEGAQQKAEEIAIAFLKEGDSPEKVSRCSNLPLEKVLELQKRIIVEA